MKPGRIDNDDGMIEWLVGTGDNAEIRHLRVREPGVGCGRRLVVAMLTALIDDPPYATVYGFTRLGNRRARGFYEAMGFELSVVNGVYDEGAAVAFAARYQHLCFRHKLKREDV